MSFQIVFVAFSCVFTGVCQFFFLRLLFAKRFLCTHQSAFEHIEQMFGLDPALKGSKRNCIAFFLQEFEPQLDRNQ